jgi:hypothetical protein
MLIDLPGTEELPGADAVPTKGDPVGRGLIETRQEAPGP